MVHKVTLMDAYLVETLRKSGISDDEIMEKVEEGKVEEFQHVHKKFDFTLLYGLKHELQEILKDGYEIKFLTIHGLINLLEMKFKKEKGTDYEENEFVLSKLVLDEEEENRLRQMVSANWMIEKKADGLVIKPIE